MSDVEPNGEVHPVAALFPMLADDELRELAEDIAANGLQQPIVLDASGALIDGRNRLAACVLAGIEPIYTTLNGQDAVAFILSANVHRRHLSKGQLAMALVLARSLSDRPNREIAAGSGLGLNAVARAGMVQRYAPELAEQVVAGSLPLIEAYERARLVKATREAPDARLERLRTVAPDLAERVDAGMDVGEAEAALGARQRAQHERHQQVTRAVIEAVEAMEGICGSAPVRSTTREHFVAALVKGSPITARRLEAIAAALTQLAEEWQNDGPA